jgi:phospholipase/carboxylesterase
MSVLDTWPETDLTGRNFLLVAGERDKYRDRAADLRSKLAEGGAEAQLETVEDGHDLGLADIEAARRWLAAAS